MKTKINAQIVAHSVNEQGDELISVLATFPRIILAEVNTHRMLSKNTSSSRAIPFAKMVETIQNDPFIPIAWQKEHKGMQGTEYLIDRAANLRDQQWLLARDNAVEMATALSSPLNNFGGDLVSEPATKQLANRLLEPFMWTTMLITGPKSGWDNFFKLRCPQYVMGNGIFKSAIDLSKATGRDWNIEELRNINKGQAEIHIMDLAEKIYDAYNESTPRVLRPREWHIPFKDKIEYNHAKLIGSEYYDPKKETFIQFVDRQAVKVSTAMAARTSYTVVGEEKDIDYEAMIKLHDRLLAQDPPHSSPLEHCARTMTNEEYERFVKGFVFRVGTIAGNMIAVKKSNEGWCNNFKGFIPYRYLVDNGN